MTEASDKPRVQRNSYGAKVERIFDHNADTRSLFLRVSGGAHFTFVPGQFISISIPLADETRTRPYSIASDPENAGLLEICFNRVPGGRGAEWLFARAVGDEVTFTGPFGMFTLDRPFAGETIFITEGTAIAPIRPMLHRALRTSSHGPMRLFYAARDREHLLYLEELAGMAKRNRQFELNTAIAPAARLYDRLLEEAKRRWVTGDNDRTRRFYVSGVGAGIIRLRDLLREAGYERTAVRYERW